MVTCDRKMVHRQVAIALIVAIPLQGIIIGADGDAAQAIATTGVWIEEVTKHLSPAIFRQPLKRLPADLVETAANAVDSLLAPVGD